MAKDTSDEHRDCYRRCFGTPDGRKVLTHLMIDMGFFDDNVGESPMRDYAAKILKTLGVSDTPQKVSQLVDKMFEISQE